MLGWLREGWLRVLRGYALLDGVAEIVLAELVVDTADPDWAGGLSIWNPSVRRWTQVSRLWDFLNPAQIIGAARISVVYARHASTYVDQVWLIPGKPWWSPPAAFRAASRRGLIKGCRWVCSGDTGTARPAGLLRSNPMIVLGIILILVGYLLPVPSIIATIGWIVLVIGVVLLVFGQIGRPVGGRRYWY
jgi:hypothetical protein